MYQFFLFSLRKAFTFANMKRAYIYIICMLVGMSFLVLLYLQGSYATDMVKMREEQFDETVYRSLDQAALDMERSETLRYLQTVMNNRMQDKKETSFLNSMDSMDSVSASIILDSVAMKTGGRMQLVGRHPDQFPTSLTLPRPNRQVKALNQLRKQVQEAYMYERKVLDEVIYAVMYIASNLRFQDRINQAELDNTLRGALLRNGIKLDFHYIVYTADGREVYRCEDYQEPEDSEHENVYNQLLFRSDPTGQMGYVQVHFPSRREYVLGVANYVLPAMIFTFILFVTFLVTVYLIVRQKKISEMKNDFVHNMTHEFKTPISTISIAAQMLSDKSVNKDAGTYERLGDVINNETRRLRFQVEKVLQMSLFDHNNIALKLQELDANELIDNVIQTFSLKVSQNGGTLDTRLEAFNPFVNVDEMHFTNVIFNLLDNAVKYRREDEPLHLEVATWNQGEDYLCISIKDNGIGIRKDDLKRIFEKFYRVHTGNKHNVKGFGLGLTYVKKMVDMHHGTIKATSEVGQGTKFIITLPIVKD